MELVCERDKAFVDVYCIVIAFGSGNDDDTAVRGKGAAGAVLVLLQYRDHKILKKCFGIEDTDGIKRGSGGSIVLS